MMTISKLASPVLAGLLCGCVADYPQDLELRGVTAVERYAPTSSDWSYAKKTFLRVDFTSALNLQAYSSENSFPISSVPYFCETPARIVDLGGPVVYWQGREVGPIDTIDMSADGDALHAYYTFLDVVFDFPGPSTYEAFDLRTAPEDVCLRLKGGAVGRGFRTNV